MSRGFEQVDVEHRKYYVKGVIPTRATKGSAGYDFVTPIDIKLEPGESKLVFTNIKAYMQEDEVLELYIRSSLAIKYGLRLNNSTGIVDQDYYSNPDNDGCIGIPLVNTSDEVVEIDAGTRIAQGIFKKYLTVEGDNAKDKREGGFGSSGE